MELEEIRAEWKRAATVVKSDQQFLRVRMLFSKDAVSAMQHNLRIEMLAVLVAYALVIGGYLALFGVRLMSMIIFLAAAALAFFIYYLVKRRLLKALGDADQPVSSRLQLQYRSLQQLMRLNVIAGTASVPLLVIFLAWFGFTNRDRVPVDNWLNRFFQQSDAVVVLIVMLTAGVLMASLWMLNRWYMKKLYGEHLERVRELIAESLSS